MADEEKTKKTPDTETIARYQVSDFANLPEWTSYIAKSEALKKADEALMAAKQAMRDVFRKSENLPDHVGVEFAKSGDIVVVTAIYKKKESERKRTAIKPFPGTAAASETEPKGRFGSRLGRRE